MRPPSTKHKVGQLRARLNEFEKPRAFDQKAFADLIGCSVHTVVSIEAERLKLSRELAWRVARATGVALHWLLDGDLEALIVNHANRPYTHEDFKRATKRSSEKEFSRRVTDDYAVTFYAEICAILSSAIKKDLAQVATRRIEKFLDQCRHEFAPDLEFREKRWFEQAAMTPAQRSERIRKRDAAARAYEKRLGQNSTRRTKRNRH
jgi:plasmid maintenance system antidote protein VapI